MFHAARIMYPLLKVSISFNNETKALLDSQYKHEIHDVFLSTNLVVAENDHDLL